MVEISFKSRPFSATQLLLIDFKPFTACLIIRRMQCLPYKVVEGIKGKARGAPRKVVAIIIIIGITVTHKKSIGTEVR